MSGAKVMIAILASLEGPSTVRAKRENRTPFHPVTARFAAVLARKLLRGRETRITEIAY